MLIELLTSIIILLSGMGAIYSFQLAWYLCSPAGRLYWDKVQRIRAQRKMVFDLFNGKDKT